MRTLNEYQGLSIAFFLTYLLWALIITTVTMLAGCGSEWMAGGAGLGAGVAASETIKGIEADLERREQALIERYNTALEAGAKAEVLDDIEKDINETVRLRQGTQAAKDVLQAIGNKEGTATTVGAIAAIVASVGLNIFQKRKGDVMKKTTRAIVKGVESAEIDTKPNPTNPVKVAIKQQLEAAGVYAQADDLIRRMKVTR